MSFDYLNDLNTEQRQAVEYGIKAGAAISAGPLRIYDDAQIRAADVAQLEQIAGGYSSRHQFLTEFTLDPPNATSGRAGAPLLDEDYTILSTIHSAKGQE